MKKIYFSMMLAAGFGLQASAQSIDLTAAIQLPTANQVIKPGQSLDTSKILCGIIYNGPDAILQGEGVFFMSSFSRPGTTPGTYYINGVQFGSDLTAANAGVVFVYPNMNMIGFGHTAAFTLASDSIHVMFDWDQWSNNDSIVVVDKPFVNGKSYGFFFRAIDVRDAGGVTISTDPVPSDNMAVTRIVWNSTTDIQGLAGKDKLECSFYPNPARDHVNVSFSLASASHCAVTLRDITGRIVMHKKYGHQAAGDHRFTVDVSGFDAGTYSLELETDHGYNTSKLAITK